MSLIGLAQIEDNQIKEAIQQSLDLIKFNFPSDTKNVVIKPNMCYYWDYSTGQTTDPKFVEALINLLREKVSPNLNISVVESDASAMKCKYAFRMLGYEKLAHECKVNLVNLSMDEYKEESVVVDDETFTFNFPKTIKEADLRINVPKLKYLAETKITCALKNIYGCNPTPQKYKYHEKLNAVIVALNKLMRFNLCILDGNFVAGVRPSKIGLVMAGQDPVAFDSVAAEIAGINPKSIPHLNLAQQEGLGNTSFTVKGLELDYFKQRYPRKKLKSKFLEVGYRMVYAVGLQGRLGLE